MLLIKTISTLKKYSKEFKIKNLGEYHDLYLRSDVLLSANVFENFRKMCLEIYELDPTKFIPAPGLAQQAALKQTGVKLDPLTDIDMLIMLEKCISNNTAYE